MIVKTYRKWNERQSEASKAIGNIICYIAMSSNAIASLNFRDCITMEIKVFGGNNRWCEINIVWADERSHHGEAQGSGEP